MTTEDEIPIEDFFEDILAKSQRGLGLSTPELSSLSGVSEEVIASGPRSVEA